MNSSIKRKRRKGIGGHQQPIRGRTDDWLTPPEIIKALGPFDLDPACPENMPWDTATEMLTPSFDGLTFPWGDRFVWLNPPYGDSAGKWVQKLASHNHGLLLVFARTETDWWHNHIWPRAKALLFLRQRIHFHLPDGSRAKFNAGAPSAIVAYGDLAFSRLNNSGIKGAFVDRR